jgi:hypothetical protein
LSYDDREELSEMREGRITLGDLQENHEERTEEASTGFVDDFQEAIMKQVAASKGILTALTGRLRSLHEIPRQRPYVSLEEARDEAGDAMESRDCSVTSQRQLTFKCGGLRRV